MWTNKTFNPTQIRDHRRPLEYWRILHDTFRQDNKSSPIFTSIQKTLRASDGPKYPFIDILRHVCESHLPRLKFRIPVSVSGISLKPSGTLPKLCVRMTCQPSQMILTRVWENERCRCHSVFSPLDPPVPHFFWVQHHNCKFIAFASTGVCICYIYPVPPTGIWDTKLTLYGMSRFLKLGHRSNLLTHGPNSEFRVPNSVFRKPNSEFRNNNIIKSYPKPKISHAPLHLPPTQNPNSPNVWFKHSIKLDRWPKIINVTPSHSLLGQLYGPKRPLWRRHIPYWVNFMAQNVTLWRRHIPYWVNFMAKNVTKNCS